MTRHSQSHRSVQHHKPLVVPLPLPHSSSSSSLSGLSLSASSPTNSSVSLSSCSSAPHHLHPLSTSFSTGPCLNPPMHRGGYVQGFMMFVVKEEQLNLSSLFFFSLTMIRPSLTSSFLTAEQTAADRSLHMRHTKINKPVQVFAGRTAVSSAATRVI